MDKENVGEWIKWRQEIYYFLTMSLLQKPEKAVLNDLLKNTWSNGFLKVYDFSQSGFLQVAQQVASFRDEEWQRLRREYEELFEGISERSIAVWESAYKGSENILLDESTLQVKRFYKKHALGVRSEVRQLCDHIGLECSFMEWLNGQLMNHLRDKNEAGFYQMIKVQKEFMNQHILSFLKPFCETLLTQTTENYYKAFSHFLYQFIAKDLEIVSGLIYGVYKHTKHERHEKMPIGFRKLTQEELADEPPVIIPTSGRNNCGGKCIIYAHVQEGSLLKLSTDTGNLASNEERLNSCTRGKGYRKTFLNANRLRYPMKRIGERGEGKFERISWEEAVNTIAEKIKDIGEKHGPASRYVNYSTGVSAVMRGDVLARRLLAMDGGYLDLYNTYSSACAEIATPYTYGTTITGSASSTLIHSKLIILWGHNPVETVFGTSTHADLIKARAAGAKIVVVDPRFSDTAAAYADQWIGIRPTTDSAMMDAMAYVIVTEALQDQGFIDQYCIGFDRQHMPHGAEEAESYFEYVLGTRDGVPKNPKWAEGITGVQEKVIIDLAREYALSKPAALIEGFGPQRHGNGEQTVRSGTMLAALTGNVGIRGGGAAGCGGLLQHKKPSVSTGHNPAGVSIPCFLWTDAVIRGKEMTAELDGVRGSERLPSPIKLIINPAGNTLINQHSDINRTISILKDTSQCEFIVCSDLFMTPSAKFADILLPGTSLFEGINITLPWRQGDYILYNNQAIEPLFESRFEYEWLTEVAGKLGIQTAFTEGHGTMKEWLKAAYDEVRKIETELPEFEKFTEAGGYKYKNRQDFIAFQKQIQDFANHPFPTPSGKIEIFSQRLYEMNQPKEIPAIPKYVPSFEGPEDELTRKYPLQLIGWHTKRRCHSVHDHNDWHAAVDKQEVWIHPKDAAARGIKEGDSVEVWNDRGRMKVPAHITHRIVEGVTAVSQGAWYRPNRKGMDTNGSINILTTSRATPLAKGNPQHSNLVEIKLSAEE